MLSIRIEADKVVIGACDPATGVRSAIVLSPSQADNMAGILRAQASELRRQLELRPCN